MKNSGIKIKFVDDKMWYKIDSEFNTNGGVYILKCSKEMDSFVPIAVNRLLADDKDGILYIGKANTFINRVIDLKKSISPQYNSNSHECGTRYKMHKGLQEKFPFQNLYIELYGDENPLELEKILLTEYESTFGELPPINRVS